MADNVQPSIHAGELLAIAEDGDRAWLRRVGRARPAERARGADATDWCRTRRRSWIGRRADCSMRSSGCWRPTSTSSAPTRSRSSGQRARRDHRAPAAPQGARAGRRSRSSAERLPRRPLPTRAGYVVGRRRAAAHAGPDVGCLEGDGGAPTADARRDSGESAANLAPRPTGISASTARRWPGLSAWPPLPLRLRRDLDQQSTARSRRHGTSRVAALEDSTIGGREYCHQLADATDAWITALADAGPVMPIRVLRASCCSPSAGTDAAS